MDSPELHPADTPQTSTELTVRSDLGRRLISAAEFQQLADVPTVHRGIQAQDPGGDGSMLGAR